MLANAKVAESLFRKATGDHRQSVTAAIFWLKTRAQWREAFPGDPGPQEPQMITIVRTIVDAVDGRPRLPKA